MLIPQIKLCCFFFVSHLFLRQFHIQLYFLCAVDPELLDNVEFEEAVEYDENSLSSASDLGLLVSSIQFD